jgi:hypothetical protein
MGKNKISIFDRTAENDIRYRGPLSYRHLQILAWICIAFKILFILTNLSLRINPSQPQWLYALRDTFDNIGEFSLPLFLFANFAIILDEKKSYCQQLVKFAGLSLMIVLLYEVILHRYVAGLFTAVTSDRSTAMQLIDEGVYSLASGGGLAFNIFIDMFLCTLLMFFMNYVPTRFFTGKRLVLFRLMALLPILYEVASLGVRLAVCLGKLRPPVFVYPFLTTKPAMSFVLFILLVLFVKLRWVRFRRRGKSREAYQAFQRTNVNSLHFSIYASIMILITGLLDLALHIFLSALLAVLGKAGTVEAGAITEEMILQSGKIASALGFGNHFLMILIIPIILLFSYTRTHKDQMGDILIPVFGVVLAVIVTVEGLYQCLLLQIPSLMNQLSLVLGTAM